MKRKKLVFLAVLAIFLTGCLNLPKKAPSWEADYQIPLTVTQATADEIIKADAIQNDGEKYYFANTLNGSAPIGFADVQVGDVSKNVEIGFPDVSIDISEALTFAAQDIPYVAGGIETLIVGDYTFSGYELIGIKNGTLRLSASNQGDSAVDFTVELQFDNNVTIAIPFINLAPGLNGVGEVNLDGKEISNKATVVIKNALVNDVGGTAKVKLDTFAINVSALSSIKGRTIDLDKDFSEIFELPTQDPPLKSITLAGGQISVGINPIEGLSITIESMKLDNVALQNIAPNSFSLAGKELTDQTQFDIKAKIVDTGTEKIVLPEKITCTLNVTNIVLDKAVVDSPTISLDTGYAIDLPELGLEEPFNNLQLDGATLSLVVKQSMGNIDYNNLKINVMLKSGSSYDVSVGTVETVLEGDKVVFTSTEVTRLVNDLIKGDLSSAKLTGSLVGVGQIEVDANTTIDYTAEIVIPLKLAGSQNVSVVLDASEPVSLNEEAKGIISKAVGNIKLEAEVTNGLPVGATISLLLQDQNQAEIVTLNGSIAAANTDINGVVTNSTKTNLILELNKVQLDSLISNPAFRVKPTITINVPENGALLGPDNTVKIRALLVVRVKVNK